MSLIFAQNLRINYEQYASAEEQSLKFSIRVVNKTAASIRKLHFASRLFTYNC